MNYPIYLICIIFITERFYFILGITLYWNNEGLLNIEDANIKLRDILVNYKNKIDAIRQEKLEDKYLSDIEREGLQRLIKASVDDKIMFLEEDNLNISEIINLEPIINKDDERLYKSFKDYTNDKNHLDNLNNDNPLNITKESLSILVRFYVNGFDISKYMLNYLGLRDIANEIIKYNEESDEILKIFLKEKMVYYSPP